MTTEHKYDTRNIVDLEFIHFAIQEAMDDNPDELETALALVERIREQHLQSQS